MQSLFKSKIDVLYDQLRKDNKLTPLSVSQVEEIDKHVSKEMREFRTELSRKQAQSAADTAKIVLTA